MHLKNMKLSPGRIQFVFSWTLRLFMLLAITGAIINQRWHVLFVSSLALFFTFLPSIIEKRFKVYLPAEFEIIILLFIYASLLLGEVHKYYQIYWWWDIILHIGSSIAIGFLGFIILFTLYEEGKIKGRPIIIAIFSFCFAMAIGALWEIFEFSMDQAFGLNMQKSGLMDTMWDLIVDALGALFTSLIGFIYLKGGKTRIFNRLLARFASENPKIFKEK